MPFSECVCVHACACVWERGAADERKFGLDPVNVCFSDHYKGEQHDLSSQLWDCDIQIRRLFRHIHTSMGSKLKRLHCFFNEPGPYTMLLLMCLYVTIVFFEKGRNSARVG